LNGGKRLRVASRDNDLCAFNIQEFGGGQTNAGCAAGDEDGLIFPNQVYALVCRQKWPWNSFSSPFLLSFSCNDLAAAALIGEYVHCGF
jgi:hypothetical protein